jgi:UDPglucose--hexose-1-phosphate uridylyltransferase
MLMAGVTSRSTLMADGRELIYYDDADTSLSPSSPRDARSIPPRPPTSTMRQDPLTGEWITIAAARSDRPVLPPTEADPLAPSTRDNPSELPGRYDVAVFENRAPAFGPEAAVLDATVLDGAGIGRSLPAVGRCEVVAFGPEPTGSLGTYRASRVRTVIEALADRTEVLSALPGVRQVFPFENRGEAIGVTLRHPHGQVYAYPFVTPRTRQLLASIARVGPELFPRIIEFESRSSRVVLEAEHWLAFVPFAARWPIEVHLLPRRHAPDLAATTDAERAELAVILPVLLRAVDAVYDSPTPYIAAWHQAPVDHGREEIRLMLQLTSPRRGASTLKYLAGSESAMGAWIGDISPERTAAILRSGIDRS